MTSNNIPSQMAGDRPSLKVIPPSPNSNLSSGEPSTNIETSSPQSSTKNPVLPIIFKLSILGVIAVGSFYIGLIPISHNVSGEGTIESKPENRQAVTMPESGLVKKIHVRQNDKVSAGQLIVEIQNDDINRQIDDINGQIIQARSDLDLAKQQLIIATSNRAQYLTRYENSLEIAKRTQQDIVQDRQPLIHRLESEKNAQRAEIKILELQRLTLQEKLANYAAVFQSGGLPKDMMLDLRSRINDNLGQIEKIKYQIAATDNQIAEVKKQKNDELNNVRQPEVDAAKAALNSASTEVQQAELEVAKRSRLIPHLEILKQKLLNRQKKLNIYATKSGIVIDSGLDLLENQKFPEGKQLLYIADSTHRIAIVEIIPEDSKLVKQGMPVIFRPQYADMSEYKAIVQDISPTASLDQTQQKRTVKVTIKFDNEQAATQLMLGTKGYAHIQTEQMLVYQKVQRELLKLFPIGKFL